MACSGRPCGSSCRSADRTLGTTRRGSGMPDPGGLAVLEQDLTALDGLAFFHVHAGAHAVVIIPHHRHFRGGRGLFDYLEGPTRDRQVESLANLVDCHDLCLVCEERFTTQGKIFDPKE